MTTSALPDKATTQAALDTARADFHALLASLSDADLARQSTNPDYTIGMELQHMADSGTFLTRVVAAAQAGKHIIPRFVPLWFIHLLNKMMTQRNGKAVSLRGIAADYDRGHTKLIETLATVRDDEWQKSTNLLGEAYTVEGVFRRFADHAGEHSASIRAALGR